jgi:hypothetical protein
MAGKKSSKKAAKTVAPKLSAQASQQQSKDSQNERFLGLMSTFLDALDEGIADGEVAMYDASMILHSL